MKKRFEQVQQKRRAVNQLRVRRIGKPGHHSGMQNSVDQGRNREDEAHDGSGSAYVKQGAIGAHRRANQNECAKCAGEVGEGNKKRIAGVESMIAAGKEVSQFMSQ